MSLTRSHGFESADWTERLQPAKQRQEHDYPPAAEADRGARTTCH